jgi:butyryl-CoA dehydrogenase
MILDQHYEDIRNMASKFSDQVIAPMAKSIDHEGFIPKEIIQKMAENGFFGIFIPEEYGGAGMDYLSYAIICEEISRGCASSGVMISAHNSLCVYPILTYGNDQQKKTYLPRLASGEWIGCFCLSEPNAGSDAGSLTTFAEDKGDHYLLNGTKNYITNGKEAKVAVVFAKTKKRDDYTGISALIVDMKSPGISIPKLEDKLGIRGSSTAQIFFDQVKVPKENLLGPEEKGFRVAMATLDGGRIGIAAQAIGIAQAAFSFAKQYALQRVQFKAPIAQLQAIQMMIADMSVKISASRLLMYQAGLLKVAGKSHTKEAASAKLFASESCMWITTKAIQICGGNGYTKEYPVERHFRDAKITEIYEGTSEVQRLVIAANEFKS